MGNNNFQVSVKVTLLFVLLLFCAALPSMAEQKGEIPDVVIEGKDSLKLTSEKPALEIPIEQNKELRLCLATEKEILLIKPRGWEKQPQDAIPAIAKSNQVIVPLSRRLSELEACVFYPLKELKSVYNEQDLQKTKKSGFWELVVADESGEIFRRYSGKGLPPENIVFDGKNDGGRMLEAGAPYSPVLRYMGRTSAGRTFTAAGVVHQEQAGFLISLDFKALYKAPPELLQENSFSAAGAEMLQETADRIKKDYFNYPVKVEVYCKNRELAVKTAGQVAKELSKMLLRGEDEIKYEGKLSAKSVERVEVKVDNR